LTLKNLFDFCFPKGKKVFIEKRKIERKKCENEIVFFKVQKNIKKNHNS